MKSLKWRVKRLPIFVLGSIVVHALFIVYIHQPHHMPSPEDMMRKRTHSRNYYSYIKYITHDLEEDAEADIQAEEKSKEEEEGDPAIYVRPFMTSQYPRRFCRLEFIAEVAGRARHAKRQEIEQCKASHHVDQEMRGLLTIQMTYSHIGTLVDSKAATELSEVENVDVLIDCMSKALRDIELPHVDFCAMTRIDFPFSLVLGPDQAHTTELRLQAERIKAILSRPPKEWRYGMPPSKTMPAPSTMVFGACEDAYSTPQIKTFRDAHLNELAQCQKFATQLNAYFYLKGGLNLIIDQQGHVSRADLISDAPEEFERCVRNKAHTWRLPPHSCDLMQIHLPMTPRDKPQPRSPSRPW